jgi:hypothetical protein
LAFGIEQALHAGYGVGVLEFVLHSRSPFWFGYAQEATLTPFRLRPWGTP